MIDEEPLPPTMTELIRAVEPGGYLFLPGAKPNTIYRLVNRVKTQTGRDDYKTTKAKNGVRVERKEEPNGQTR